MPRKKTNLTEQVWFRLKPSELFTVDTLAKQATKTRAAMIRFLVIEGIKSLRAQSAADESE